MSLRRRLGLFLTTVVVGVAAWAVPASAIVGGVEVDGPSLYPYFVRLHIGNPNGQGFTLCGGSLITELKVLTAAHCVDDGVTPNLISAFIGDFELERVTGIEIHPLWNGDYVDGHDLAVLELKFKADHAFPPVQVGDPFQPWIYDPGKPATIVGRGARHHGDTPPLDLFAADTIMRSDDDMDDIYNPWYWFDEWNEPLMIGAGTSHVTVCNGDSGSPLLGWVDDRPVQVGVASFVSDDCDEPGGFMELANAQLAWVASKVPEVKNGWGPCPNAAQVPFVQYVGWYVPTAKKDGTFYWQITCMYPGEPGPDPGPDPGPTDPPICDLHPEKCPPPKK